jgi:hypothetical protein
MPPRRQRELEPLKHDDRWSYSEAQLHAMNTSFRQSMTDAIAAGLEFPPATAVSTAPGTVRPIYYLRAEY